MDAWEATDVVFQRVRALDRENATKIVGTLLVKDGSETELTRLAVAPDHHLRSVVARTRAEIAAKASSSSPVLGPPLSQAGRLSSGMPSSGGAAEQAPPRREQTTPWRTRPCVYFARGFCKHGSSCRYLHSLPPQNDAAAMQGGNKLALAAPPPPPPLMHYSTFPPQLQSTEVVQRSTPMLVGSGGTSTFFPVRSPPGTMDRAVDDELMKTNPAAPRQIYLTFPANATFTRDDLIDYFSSKYGPVENVVLPYQRNRTFGFVKFVYPESAKMVLCDQGNPHYVRGARVFVKPYKDKIKVPQWFRKLQQPHHSEFPGGSMTTPTGPFDHRSPFDLQQLHLGPRMTRPGAIATQEQQQQAAGELHQAIELQGRRFMGLQLLEQTQHGQGSVTRGNGNAVHLEDLTTITQGNKSTSATAAESEHDQQQQQAVVNNHGDYNLPENPFSSPVKADKASVDFDTTVSTPPYNSYFFQQVPTRSTSGL